MSVAASSVHSIGDSGCPYPGLRRFTEADAPLYFGREREVARVIGRLRNARFVVITGESGCGKSSLIRAGVIPALHGHVDRVCILQPGDDPIGRLAGALTGTFGDAGAAMIGLTEAALRSSSRGLIEAVRQGGLDSSQPLLILVDQFEEIFRFKQSVERPDAAEDARAFVRLLLTSTLDAPNLYVVLTMRSDFLGECAQFTGLPEAINRGEYLLSRPTRDELRQAITKPAEVTDARVAPRLAAQLLNEAGDDPGELPVLQHALMRTWQEWQRQHEPGEPIDLKHYTRAGTLKDALSAHADEVYNGLGDAQLQTAASLVFRALTEIQPGGRPVRRPASMAQLERTTGQPATSVEKVVRRFADAGFLLVNGIVDLTHESLITRWKRLADWTAIEARDAELYRTLARDAALHARKERGLWRNPELGIAAKWRDQRLPTEDWAKRIDPNFQLAMAFLKSSEESEKRYRLLWRALLGAAVLAVVLVMASLWWAQRARADRESARAETERVKKDAAVGEQQRLQRRIRELTVENPQLNDEAVALRKEVRTLEWSIVRLSQESRQLEWETSELDRHDKDLEASAANLNKEIAGIGDLTARAAAQIESLRAEAQQLQSDQQALTAKYTELRKVNTQLRTVAVERGMILRVPEFPGGEGIGAGSGSASAGSSAKPISLGTTSFASSGDADELNFKLKQLELENLVLKQSIDELRAYRAKLQAEEAAELARNQKAKSARQASRAAVDTAAAMVRDLESRRSAAQQVLNERSFERDSLSSANSAKWRSVYWLKNAIPGVDAENKAIQRWLEYGKR